VLESRENIQWHGVYPILLMDRWSVWKEVRAKATEPPYWEMPELTSAMIEAGAAVIKEDILTRSAQELAEAVFKAMWNAR
jgi:hypothetical protein